MQLAEAAENSDKAEDTMNAVGHLMAQQREILDRMQNLWQSLATPPMPPSTANAPRLVPIPHCDGDAISISGGSSDTQEHQMVHRTQAKDAPIDQIDVLYTVSAFDTQEELMASAALGSCASDKTMEPEQPKTDQKGALTTRQLTSLENYVWEEKRLTRIIGQPLRFSTKRKEPQRHGCLAGIVLSDKFELAWVSSSRCMLSLPSSSPIIYYSIVLMLRNYQVQFKLWTTCSRVHMFWRWC